MQRNLNLVLLGNSGCGKSTIGGALMYAKDKVDEKTLDKLKKETEMLGRNNSHFAFVMDTLKAEKDRGLTLSNKFVKFQTENHNVTLIDVPGHRDSMRATITGMTQGDCAILVLNAQGGDFELGLKEGVTKEQTLLAFNLGVREIIVVVNKMENAAYSEERFSLIAMEIKFILKATGYNLSKVSIIPVSGVNGDNISKHTAETKWYTGPTLVKAIDKIRTPLRPIDLPLRLPVNDSFKISGIGTVVVGRVETGVIKKGMKIAFCPGTLVSECMSIESHGVKINEAYPGDNIGFNILGVSCKDVRPGQVASDANNKPASEVVDFLAQIVVLNHPTKIEVGYTPIIYCHNAQVACKIVEIRERIDKLTGKIAEKNPKSIANGDAAVVRFKPTKPMCVETYKEYAPLGRFAVRDMKQTVAVGIIKETTKKEVVAGKK